MGAAFSRDGAGFGREVSPRMASEQVGKVATPRRGRGNTQAQPAARQAGKEARRERIKIGRTVCISRLSGSEGGEGMRFASLFQIPWGANHPVSGAPRVGESEAGRPRVSPVPPIPSSSRGGCRGEPCAVLNECGSGLNPCGSRWHDHLHDLGTASRA